ncbi:unnamed protein product [Spirodela intermedia]|uniref:Uncharacterized protein n=1 Tax=Spirodela intermedia TaxID=51605 RepID=A0A7I8L171_SPIIN|nr:unnamed protein product [Spirodela intermedia]
MRIRKHASRVISSPSIPNPSCAGGCAAAEMAAAYDLEMSLCELNQSPWDTLPPTPPEGGSGHYFQVRSDRAGHLLFRSSIELVGIIGMLDPQRLFLPRVLLFPVPRSEEGGRGEFLLLGFYFFGTEEQNKPKKNFDPIDPVLPFLAEPF